MINRFMKKRFVKVQCDVYCTGWSDFPVYRAFVNDELFCERTWIWHDQHLEESFQIEAKPGKYKIRYELLPGTQAAIQQTNWQILHGSGFIDSSGNLEIV